LNKGVALKREPIEMETTEGARFTCYLDQILGAIESIGGTIIAFDDAGEKRKITIRQAIDKITEELDSARGERD
jgi:hypothetical protein